MKADPIILVMERGFVLVGRIVEESTMELTLDDVSIIRTWGTTKGLGQLATEGPQSGTIFDREPDGEVVNKLCCYRRLKCNGKKWQKYPEGS